MPRYEIIFIFKKTWQQPETHNPTETARFSQATSKRRKSVGEADSFIGNNHPTATRRKPMWHQQTPPVFPIFLWNWRFLQQKHLDFRCSFLLRVFSGLENLNCLSSPTTGWWDHFWSIRCNLGWLKPANSYINCLGTRLNGRPKEPTPKPTPHRNQVFINSLSQWTLNKQVWTLFSLCNPKKF